MSAPPRRKTPPPAKSTTTAPDLFDTAPPHRLQRRLGLIRPGQSYAGRRMAMLVLIGWVPLLALSSAFSSLNGGAGLSEFITDVAVHVRSLIAAPLLILAEVVCAPILSSTAHKFGSGGFILPEDEPRYEAALARARHSLQSPMAEWIAIALAFAIGISLVAGSAHLPAVTWQRDGAALSPAGWWDCLVTVPLLLMLMFGWLWRLFTWISFLFRVSRLKLQIFPPHPDGAGGLLFAGQSLRALALPALAFSCVIAGIAANNILHRPVGTMMGLGILVTSLVVIATLACISPLLMLSGTLVRGRLGAMADYGALATTLGSSFAKAWFARSPDLDALGSQASTMADFSQVASNAANMRLIPIDFKTLLVFVVAMVAPFVPVVLLLIPLSEIVEDLAKFLL
jgi:hypothetical protein